MKLALIYSLKVWLTGMCLAFIGMIEVSAYSGLTKEPNYLAVALRALITLGLSSPSYAIPLFVSVWVLQTMNWTTITLKCVLCGLTLIFALFPFMLLVIIAEQTESFSKATKDSILVYIILNCTCIWFYNIESENKPKVENF